MLLRLSSPRSLLFILLLLSNASLRAAEAFTPDEAAPPKTQPALAPLEGATILVNPPSLAWKHDARAASYMVEFAPTPEFSQGVIRVSGIPYAYYNHTAALATGTWRWRYFVVAADGRVSSPSKTHSFQVAAGTPALPLPDSANLMKALPGHPRVFVTPATLASFRAQREGAGQMAWEQVRLQAEEALKKTSVNPELLPVPEKLPSHRRQLFWLEHGTVSVPKNYSMLDLLRDADEANLLSFAFLISGDRRYADAAKAEALRLAHFRMDYHLKTVAERGQHDTVVYAYERGLKDIALVYDRLQDFLTADERQALLDHIEYHGDAAFHWIREVMHLQLNYQDSHGQQCMHMLLTTALAVAHDSKKADTWLAYMVPQYANRIPWMSEDGGYFEGQAYAFKLSYILEALAALRSATGLDLFQKPEIKNAGDFFLYCQSMNYWWPHWGDTMGLWFPFGNVGDGFMSALLATMTNNRPLQWWSEIVPADPSTPPFGYLAATGLRPQPPVTLPQARAFVPTGVVAAFDRHYDQATTRLFFRSSPWGGESHAHADQNSFVLHSGGEIFAADTGYYTYYGDENYEKVSTQTVSHNSVLVDGKGQTNDLAGEGSITAFFNSPRYTFMAGDASKAYGSAMEFFRRDLLFLRPNLVIVADELRAPQPAEFTWLLNTFAPPAIDQGKHEFTVTERGEIMWGKHVFPETLRIEASDRRLAPRKTKVWTRFTEAFPEPWRLRTITEKTAQADLLTVLQPYHEESGERVVVTESARDEHGSALRLKIAGGSATVLLRRKIAERENYEGLGVQTDGRAALVETGADGEMSGWLSVNASLLRVAGKVLYTSVHPVSIAFEKTAAAGAQITISAPTTTTLTLTLPAKPGALRRGKPGDLDHAVAGEMHWSDGKASFEIMAGESVVLIDPKFPAAARPEKIILALAANGQSQPVSFETATADNGDWMAYATVVPTEPGFYEIASADAATEILVQDRWDSERSVRGRGKVRALVGDHTEIILRFAPAAKLPRVQATLAQAVPFSRINLLRNGDCEAGLPGYPPRGWTVQNGCTSETYGEDGLQGWPGWSAEAAAGGKAALKFIRPLNTTVDWRAPFPVLARNQMVALAPPVRLLQGGKYLLSCATKGSATTASVEIESSAGVTQTIALAPSENWEKHQLELELPAGYTRVRVKFSEGGRDDQLLWADDFSLTPVEKK